MRLTFGLVFSPVLYLTCTLVNVLVGIVLCEDVKVHERQTPLILGIVLVHPPGEQRQVGEGGECHQSISVLSMMLSPY